METPSLNPNRALNRNLLEVIGNDEMKQTTAIALTALFLVPPAALHAADNGRVPVAPASARCVAMEEVWLCQAGKRDRKEGWEGKLYREYLP